MITFLCTFVILYILVSLAWPSSRKKQQESDRKHQELLAAIEKLKPPKAPPAPPPRPTFGSAERARILALGKIKDGDRRHPILDAPFVSVANPPKQQP